MSERVEFDPDEWKDRPSELEHIVPIGGGREGECVCAEPGDCYVFVCRADGPNETACGRYCCECFGTDDDTLCCECWVKSYPGLETESGDKMPPINERPEMIPKRNWYNAIVSDQNGRAHWLIIAPVVVVAYIFGVGTMTIRDNAKKQALYAQVREANDAKQHCEMMRMEDAKQRAEALAQDMASDVAITLRGAADESPMACMDALEWCYRRNTAATRERLVELEGCK